MFTLVVLVVCCTALEFCFVFVDSDGLGYVYENSVSIYRISRPIRRTFFPEKCDLNLNCVLYAEGKYLFPNL
jgi:hypothetical protein